MFNTIKSTVRKRKLKRDYCHASRAIMADISMKKFIITAFAAGMCMGLLFASLSFISSQRNHSKDAAMYLTSGQAKLISSNVNGALSFNDAKDANTILETLKTQSNVIFAGVYDCNGKLFASYNRGDINPQEFKQQPPSKAKFRFYDGYMVVTEPVFQEHKLLGTVCLWAQM